jgi:serine/threonine protein kinase
MDFRGYTLLDKIRSDCCGEEYVATRHDSPGTLFAAKLINHDEVDETHRRSEERALRSLTGHPHVVELVEVGSGWCFQFHADSAPQAPYSACIPQTFTGIRRVRERVRSSDGDQVLTMIVTRCDPRHGVHDYIAQQPFSEPLARTYLEQLLSALSHAHSKGISHGNVQVCAPPYTSNHA